MDLNELIYNRLAGSRELADVLAKFSGYPAIFNSEFPSDQEAGWEGKSQYPRICYRIDMQVNQERSSAGMLHVTVHTEKDSLVIETIENFVRGCLKDVLMKPSGQAPFCVAWAGTEPYVLDGMAVICKDILFDILEYPDQETTDPDPVMAVGTFIKDMYPDAVVLGIDRIGDYTNPADKPVFYCRLEDIQRTRGHCEHSIALLIGVPYVPRTQRPDLSALAQKQLTSIPPFSKGIFSNTDLMKFSHHSIFTFFISLTAFHVFFCFLLMIT